MADERIMMQMVISLVDNAAAGMEAIADGMVKIGDAATGAGDEGGISFTELKSKIDLVLGAVNAVSRAVQEGLEFAEMGAQVAQLEESFNRVNRQMGMTPEYMRQIDDATGGTIPKLQQYAGLNTLIAGTTDEFGGALAGAYPQLIEYARAAAKLNPTLGDTSFMLESISTGLKRGSPMILDNLGLVVKVGDANEQYAQSIGKAVEELTAEEKQLALLNATMTAGERLVEQVGGTVDSTTDAFDRMRASTADLKAELAKLAKEEGIGIAGLISRNAEYRTAQLILRDLKRELRDYNGAVVEEAEAAIDAQLAESGLIGTREEVGEELRVMTEQIDNLLAARRAIQDAMEDEAASWRRLGAAQDVQAESAENAARAARENVEHAESMDRVLDQNVQSIQAYDHMLERKIEAENAAIVTVQDLTRAQEELKAKQELAAGVWGTAETAVRNSNMALRDQEALIQSIKLQSGDLTETELQQQRAIELLTQRREAGSLTNGEYIQQLADIIEGNVEYADIIESSAIPASEEFNRQMELGHEKAGDFQATLENMPEDFVIHLDTSSVDEAINRAGILRQILEEIGNMVLTPEVQADFSGESLKDEMDDLRDTTRSQGIQ